MNNTAFRSVQDAYSSSSSYNSSQYPDSDITLTGALQGNDSMAFNNDVTRYNECSADILTCQIQRYLFLIMSPVLILVATVGNGLSLAVMTRKSLRSTATAVFISSLAVSDTIAVWTALTRHFIKKLTEVCLFYCHYTNDVAHIDNP